MSSYLRKFLALFGVVSAATVEHMATSRRMPMPRRWRGRKAPNNVRYPDGYETASRHGGEEVDRAVKRAWVRRRRGELRAFGCAP